MVKIIKMPIYNREVVMQFDDDEVIWITDIEDDGEFSIVLKDTDIKFMDRKGKTFKIFIQDKES